MITFADLPDGHPGRQFLSGDTTWFALQADRRFSYGLHVPSGFEPGTPHPVVVVVHDTNRRAQDLRAAWAPFSERHGALVVAPLFPAGAGHADDIDGYKLIRDGDTRYDLALEEMLREVRERGGALPGRFLLFGHSGGAQFATRMLLLHPDRLAAAAISAPGRITLIDPGRPWPAGTGDTAERFGVTVDPPAIARVPVLLTAGDRDDGTADLAAAGDPSQAGFGATRLARLATLAANLRAHGVDVRHQLVPGAGHAGDPTTAVAQAFLAEALAR